MKHTLLTLALLLLGALSLNARPVDLALAKATASKFSDTPELVYARADGAFYVFNLGTTGFVIIAGDDAYRPVIGYSDESTFDADHIPPALADHLEGIAQNINRLRARKNAQASPKVAAEWESVLNHGRLLSYHGGRSRTYFCQTQWNQTYPYNYCCPVDPNGSGGHAIVGCLATAMSQLMRFWASPAQGIGSHCYNHEDYGEICADFGATTYDWEHMPNVLNENSTLEEKQAVGTLCFHCGVTIDMGYGPDGSGGASGPIPGVMHQYFNYSDANVQLRRNDYDLETWKRMVREQFDMGWPMYYGGCQDGGCHAFVCDGYDDADMFHFNLGWGGGSDGWYIIDEAPYTDPADAMFNFVPAEIYNITPGNPTDFTVEVPVETELRTVLRWTNPTASLDNTPLTSIEEVVVMRNNQVIQVLTDLTPGQNVEWKDSDVPFYDTYQYTVYAKANGRYGKHAYVLDVTVGPSCQWKVVMTTSNFNGWNGGHLSIYNNNGTELACCTMTSSTPSLERPMLPLGHLSFGWTAPDEPVDEMGFVIKDAQGQEVYSFNGSSEELEPGVFLRVNNTCGGDQSCETVQNLVASKEGDHIRLTWDAVGNEGYGYNIYRDGQLFRLIPAGTTTSYLDEQAPEGGHCYRIAVLCEGGEGDEMSNESCASAGRPNPPRNLDYELTATFRIKLKWERPIHEEGVDGYAVYRRQPDGEYALIDLLYPSKTTYTDYGPTQEGDYYYRVCSYYEDCNCYSSPANRKYYPNVFELHAYYSPTGLNEANAAVTVYPNPSQGTVKVEARSMSHVKAFNTLGQCVLDKETSGDTFEWSPVAKGVYLMQIDTENGVFYSKFVAL